MVWAAYPPRPALSRFRGLADLFEMPQAATQILAGCKRDADSSAFAILVRRGILDA
jgi:hypothetical protein